MYPNQNYKWKCTCSKLG